jgi:hypothetical protein
MRTNIDGGRKALLTIGAGGLVVAAAYFAAGLFVNPPGLSNGSGAQALAAIAANAGEQRLGTLLDWTFAVVIMVAVVFVAAGVSGGRGATLTAVGACLTAVGDIFHGAVIAVGLVAADMVTSGSDRTQMGALVDRMNADPYVGGLLLPLMITFVLGLVIFAFGLWRARVTSIWPAVLIVAGAAIQALAPDSVNQFAQGTVGTVAMLWIAGAIFRITWLARPAAVQPIAAAV